MAKKSTKDSEASTNHSSTYKEIMMQLEAGRVAPLYMLCGDEPYYIDLISNYMEEHILDEAAKAFDLTIAYGKDYEKDMSAIISAARGFPMCGDKQLIIVKEAQLIKNWEPLVLYRENPQPSTILVFCYKYGTPKASAFKEWSKNGGIWLESKKLYDNQVPGWIVDYVVEWNKANKDKEQAVIDERVATLLAVNLGNDLSRIVTELQKLVDGRPKGVSVITPELVERNVGISKDFNLFELEEALQMRDSLKAFRIVQYFASSKEHPIQKELPALFSFFRNILLYHYAPDKSGTIIAKELETKPFLAQKVAIAARSYTASQVFRIIGFLREYDGKSKGMNNPSADEGELWKELIYKILHC